MKVVCCVLAVPSFGWESLSIVMYACVSTDCVDLFQTLLSHVLLFLLVWFSISLELSELVCH